MSSSTTQGRLRVTVKKNRSAETVTMIELAARRLSCVRWIRYVRISAGPRCSGDLRKWEANRTTCETYTRCVFGVRLRICMSSIMRRRSGLIDNSSAKEQRHMAPPHRHADELSGQGKATDGCRLWNLSD